MRFSSLLGVTAMLSIKTLAALQSLSCPQDCPILSGLSASMISSMASEFCSTYIQSTVTTTCSDTVLAMTTTSAFVEVTSTSTVLVTNNQLSVIASVVTIITSVPASIPTSINSGSSFLTVSAAVLTAVHKDRRAIENVPSYLSGVPAPSISSACSCFVTPSPPVTVSLAVGPTHTEVATTTIPTATAKYSDFETTTVISTTSTLLTKVSTRTVMYSYSSPLSPESSSSTSLPAVYSAPSITYTPPFHTTAVLSTVVPSTISVSSLASPSLSTSVSVSSSVALTIPASSISNPSSTSPTSSIPVSPTSAPPSGCIGTPGCIFGDDIISTIDLPTNNTQQCEEDCAATTSCLSIQYGYPSASGGWNCNLLNDTAANAWDQDGTEGDEEYCDQYIIYDVPCF